MINRFVSSLRGFAMSVLKKPEVLFVLGGPGAGKGTQCANIVKEFGYVHLSAGDLLREERSRPESEYGGLIESHIRNGSIVPVEITCSLLERAMQNSPSNKFLIDGFPRNKDNLDGWNKAMMEKVNLRGVFFFDCSEEICIRRCLSRGALGSGRTDDNEESLKKRCHTYVNATIPIIQHYESQGVVYKIDATRTPEQVFEEVKKTLQRLEK